LRGDPDPLDPASVPPVLAPDAESLSAIDIESLRSSFGTTVEDAQLERMEPMFARFAPHALAGLYRRLLGSAGNRHGIRLRQLGWEVPKHVLLLSDNEEPALDDARRGLFMTLPDAADDCAATEGYLLLALLTRHEAAEQAWLLIERPAAAKDLGLVSQKCR